MFNMILNFIKFRGVRFSGKRQKGGFSLIEVTLALMVLSVAVMTLFSLYPGGLEQGIKAEADSYAAFFAQEVFAGLKDAARADWENLENAEIQAAAADMWDDNDELLVTINEFVATNVFANSYEPDVVNYALRYKLEIITTNNVKAVWLRIWDGEFGSLDAPRSYYTEFYRDQFTGF